MCVQVVSMQHFVSKYSLIANLKGIYDCHHVCANNYLLSVDEMQMLL